MLFWTIVKVGLKSLLANKLRSLLAMLGIIIGVAAVISMLAIGAGAKKQVLGRISAMGTNLLMIRPQQSGSAGVKSGTSQRLTLDDATAILNEIDNVASLAPAVSGNAQVKYMSKNSRTSVMGTSTTYMPIRDFHIDKGRGFTESECDANSRVAVLGPQTVTDLFENDDPLGATIKVNSINFTVIGVLKSKGDQGFYNPDDQVLVPYTTAMKQLFGVTYLREVDVQCAEGADLDKVQTDITALLRKRHKLQAMEQDDFSIRNQADMIQTATEVTQTFTTLLGCVAGISLLVGGIGIMNIMLVTVTERTREIGVRKAIGARRKSIRMQFLIESMIISGLGGFLGVAFGVAAASVIGAFTTFQAVVQAPSIFMALSFSAIVGVFFGWYPAARAAALDPVDALRYE